MSCEITTRNGLPVGKTYPSLMQSILISTDFNTDQALELYGVTLLDEFKDLNISNPTLENIRDFIEQDNKNDSTNLNKKDRQLLLDISVNSNQIEDLKTRFLDAFEVDSKFGINAKQLRDSGIFSDSDIMYLLDTDDLRPIRNLYYKLSQTEEQFDSIQTDVVISQEGLSKMNPDLFEQNALNYLGLTTAEEIIGQAQETGDSLITDNPSLANEILKVTKNKSALVQYETDEYSGQVVSKTQNSSLTRLEQTFDLEQDFSAFLNQLEFLRLQPIGVYVENLPVLSEYVQNLVSQAQDLGLDLNDLAQTYDKKTYVEIQDFLDSLYNFLTDASSNDSSIEESMLEYVQTRNIFFNTQPQDSKTWTLEDISDSTLLHLETNQSEEALFNKHSIVKLFDNTYQKVQPASLDSLYDLISRNPELVNLSIKPTQFNQDLVYQEIDAIVSNQTQESLRPDSNVETLKILTAYKILLGSRPDTQNPVTGDLRLNPQNFLVQFNKDLLKNKTLEDIFYISNRGLESRQVLGDYTLKQLENNLTDKKFRDLVKYAKLSGNESLQPLTALFNDYENSVGTRDYLANNLQELPQYNQDYSNQNGYVVTDSNEDFLKIKSELYENVAPYVYAKVETNPRYLNQDLQKPSYDNSVVPDIKQSEGRLKTKTIKQTTENIEFC